MKNFFRVLTIVSLLLVGIVAVDGANQEIFAKTYTISPSSKPCNGYSYNKENHGYLLIRSYMQKFEKNKGGTLVLKKGTYKISNTIYVPSNVTIKFKNGVKLVKNNKTGADYDPSSTFFQFIRDSKGDKKNVVGKYNGEKNIKFIGEGNVVFDMKNYNKGTTPTITMVMANNKNVTIEGITFKNIKHGHFIEMDGCNKVTIKDCKFMGMKDNDYHNKEAINLDTNDAKTGGFSQQWSKEDKTPNKDITIENCVFKNLVRAVGTHRYSKNKYHTKIKFINNTVTKVMTPLGMLNWKNATVKGNTFTNCKSNKKYNYTVLVAGVKNMTFTDNKFKKCKSEQLFKIYKSYQTGHKTYPATTTVLSKKNIDVFKENIVINCSESSAMLPSKEVIEFPNK